MSGSYAYLPRLLARCVSKRARCIYSPSVSRPRDSTSSDGWVDLLRSLGRPRHQPIAGDITFCSEYAPRRNGEAPDPHPLSSLLCSPENGQWSTRGRDDFGPGPRCPGKEVQQRRSRETSDGNPQRSQPAVSGEASFVWVVRSSPSLRSPTLSRNSNRGTGRIDGTEEISSPHFFRCHNIHLQHAFSENERCSIECQPAAATKLLT